MDLKAVSTKITEPTKSALATITNTLDALAPMAAPLALRWDTEADRRTKLRTPENLKKLMDAQRAHNSARSTAATARSQRTVARSASKNPFSAGRKAARTADKAARQHREQAKAALKSARRDYPATLTTRAVQAHAVHTVPGVGASWLMSTAEQWTLWPASVSAGLIALNAGALWLGRRKLTVVVDDGASLEERQLMERLDPAYWVQHAPDRGLGGTVTGVPQLGGAGITCPIRLDGQWDVAKLAGAESHIRNLLGCRTALRLRIRAGDRGGWAVLTLGTRTAVDGASLLWTPERQGIGLDTGTGEVVTLPHGRKVIAGTSGAGKSVLLRAILAPYALDPMSAVIYLDAKGEESGLWRHCAREAIDPEDISEVVAELVDEMLSRRDLMRERQIATWQATEERPRLVVLVDEGADLMAMDSRKVPILPGLEQIARQGRSRLVDLLWCTQKPTVGEGIPSQIIGNMSVRVVLQTAGQTETQQIMGKGWQNHMLPGPGLAYVRGTGRDMEQSPVAVWDASDDKVVTSLPARTPWHRKEAPAGTAGASAPAPLRLVKGEDYELAPPAAAVPAQPKSQPTNREKVAAAIGSGSRTVADVANVTGINKGSVSKAVKSLVEAGEVARDEDGVLSLATQAGEVSA
ncbi:S-DNA-T family DNA segregation ATPase FtsK/SpoIIIE [Streptomyces luteogriseus]|uniref:S-DNA-T family DNA segregation ATPase FtsK/SpoIIIE n=1 Tax=Streptomyces luteogriseus TaxID=68233 RepID=A0A7W7DY29_9ACTN|nr:FtsK/SpoIIIE domain-containing protein [Streptomyces luteogriseus]MBB4717852.1 S-DNA-T family DNA segregation ATPase FtsK/SpoIIIE [Streptomyces luteogriseus]MBB4717861.1 S-DNA-T family DNA segregation ATPase FtsK/SpoIIIE [Streptomyces luteogriseus]